MIITIDGPSGAGKGTLSQLLADKLGAELLDSGALYRLVALASLERGLAPDDEPALADCARHLNVRFITQPSGVMVELDGRDVSGAIREERVGMRASQVAALDSVRRALLQRQRDFSRCQALVADGRDMGTTVFPGANYKFFLTASAEARAQRRYQQLQARGERVDMATLVADIRARDQRDQSRASSPLRPAEDAVLIDSTDMTIDQVLEAMLGRIGPP